MSGDPVSAVLLGLGLEPLAFVVSIALTIAGGAVLFVFTEALWPT